MNILFLCHRIPYPPNKGDKIRSFNEIKYLSKTHRIDLVCLADDPDDMKYRKDLEGYCRRVHVAPLNKMWGKIKGLINFMKGGTISVGYFYNRNIQMVVNRWLLENTYDAIICFSSPMAEYIFRSKPKALSSKHPAPRYIMDFCDVDSDKWRQYAQKAGFLLKKVYKAEFERLLTYERKINQTVNHSIFVSQKEAELFESLAPDSQNISVISNGVDFIYFNPDITSCSTSPAPSSQPLGSPVAGPHSLLFAGAMDYHANVDGVTWFCRDIFPLLQKANAYLDFYIVGSNPLPDVRALSDIDGVKITGFVEDIRPYYVNADICVIPLRLARGVQNKVLEAMAMRKPIVTTSAAIQGISATPGEHLLVADTPQEFIERINALLYDKAWCKQLGANARKFVAHTYHWHTNLEKLNKLITAGSMDG